MPATAAEAGPSAPAGAGEAGYGGPVQVRHLLLTGEDAAGRPLAYPEGKPQITVLHIEVPPGTYTGWHRHPMPAVAYMLEGELRVTLKDGRENVIRAGEAMTEVVDFEHNGYNPGPGPARLVMTVIGVESFPFTIRVPAPASPAAPANPE